MRLWRAFLQWLDALQVTHEEHRALALALHRSNAWHCGCHSCRPRPLKVLGVRVETWHVTPEERARLRGEK